MWSQSTRLVREGALGPLSFARKDSIQSNQRTFKQNSYWLIGVSYNSEVICLWRSRQKFFMLSAVLLTLFCGLTLKSHLQQDRFPATNGFRNRNQFV